MQALRAPRAPRHVAEPQLQLAEAVKVVACMQAALGTARWEVSALRKGSSKIGIERMAVEEPRRHPGVSWGMVGDRWEVGGRSGRGQREIVGVDAPSEGKSKPAGSWPPSAPLSSTLERPATAPRLCG